MGMSRFFHLFQLEAKGTTLQRELVGGVTTSLAMHRFGLVAYAVAKLATRRRRECPVLVYIFAALFVSAVMIM